MTHSLSASERRKLFAIMLSSNSDSSLWYWTLCGHDSLEVFVGEVIDCIALTLRPSCIRHIHSTSKVLRGVTFCFLYDGVKQGCLYIQEWWCLVLSVTKIAFPIVRCSALAFASCLGSMEISEDDSTTTCNYSHRLVNEACLL
jgi:hypothetical protein